MKDDVFAVIAAFNEEKNIGKVVAESKKFCRNIVVVDDGSKDNTFGAAKKAGAVVLKHIVNMGKGAAAKTGCDYAVKNGAKILILLDADGQHEPKEIPNFIKALEGKGIVYGYRKMSRSMPFILKIGNKSIGFITRILYGQSLKDTQSGYRALTSKAYRKVRWKACDYAMESEMIANAGKHRLKYEEIPIATIYSDKYKGTTVLDGIKIVINMVLWRLTR